MNTRQFIQWQDVFVFVDNGSLPASHYSTFGALLGEQAKSFPKGIGILCILPPEAKPPPDDVKQAVKSALSRISSSISCLGYAIEGTGFRGVTARATLVGMKIFSSRPYPIYVETSVKQALTRMAAHMANGSTISLELVMKQIAETRLAWTAPVPPPPKDHEISLK